ncbi:MAG TPA: hypothetical protein VK157_08840 [Phycisphaerales bacterium]|nr:hypothetical protein [Phycisphaerales bacterium]
MANKPAPAEQPPKEMTCGIVMPISTIDGMSESHWRDVKTILELAIRAAEFKPNLVSDAEDAGVIHRRIVQNLYENPVVVVDVSCRNPNVMFELGMRLTFDKPTVIVCDDKTPFIFDTRVVEHIIYPRDLRHPLVEAFKAKLADKIASTIKNHDVPGQSSSFMKNFGPFVVPKLETRVVDKEEFILNELRELRGAVLARQNRPAFLPDYSSTMSQDSPERRKIADLASDPDLMLGVMSFLQSDPKHSTYDTDTLVEHLSEWPFVANILASNGVNRAGLRAKHILRRCLRNVRT